MKDKVITTMVIRPLDDLQSLRKWESEMGSFDSPHVGFY